jgi:hypothetical protein
MISFNKTIRGLVAALASFTLTIALCIPSGAVSALSATSSDMPLDFIRSADCTGELVEISGMIHFVNQTRADGSVIGHFNYQNVTGLGLTSGHTYQTSAVDHIQLGGSDVTSVANFYLISRGSGSNLLVQVLYHITINGNGDVTVSIDDLNTQCT